MALTKLRKRLCQDMLIHSRLWRTVSKKLFPKAPAEPEVKLILGIEEYLGVYYNIRYGELTFTIGKGPGTGRGALRCEVTDRTWPQSLVLRPVNTERWLGHCAEILACTEPHWSGWESRGFRHWDGACDAESSVLLRETVIPW